MTCSCWRGLNPHTGESFWSFFDARFHPIQKFTMVYNSLERKKKNQTKTYNIIFINNKKQSARFSAYCCSSLVVLMCDTVICPWHVLLEKFAVPVVKKNWLHKLETWLQRDLGKILKMRWFTTFVPLLSEYLNVFCKWNLTTVEHQFLKGIMGIMK